MNPEQIFNNAKAAAQAASDKAEEHFSWYPCGFAWIIIKPARGKFITWCKKNGVGRKGAYGGWRISSYELSTQSPKASQSLDVKSEATSAAVDVLREAGINAELGTAWD